MSRNATPAVARYLNGLRNWIRGNLEWHATSGRHHHRDGRATPTTARDRCTHRPPTGAELSAAPATCPYYSEEHGKPSDGLDVLSLPKELAAGEVNNLVIALAKQVTATTTRYMRSWAQ